jgi:hypothetical protein
MILAILLLLGFALFVLAYGSVTYNPGSGFSLSV